MGCKVSLGITNSCSAIGKSSGLCKKFWVGYLSDLDSIFSLTQSGDVETIDFGAYGYLYPFEGTKYAHDYTWEKVDVPGGTVSYVHTLNWKLIPDTTADDLQMQYLLQGDDIFIIVETPNREFYLLGAGSGLTGSAGNGGSGGKLAASDVSAFGTLTGNEKTIPLRFSLNAGYNATKTYLENFEAGRDVETPDTNSAGQQAFLVIGDSKAGDTTASDGYGPTTPSGVALKWNGSGLTDVAATDFNNESGTYGTIWKKFALDYNAATGKKVVIINEASGGSEIYPNGDNNNWYTSGTLFTPAVSNANACMLHLGVTRLKGIFIQLGINDANGSQTITNIRTALRSLIERLQSNFPDTPIYLTDVGIGSVSFRRDDIDKLYDNDFSAYAFYDGNTHGLGICHEYNNVYQWYKYSKGFVAAGYNFDSLHYGQTGNNLLGEKLCDFIMNQNQLEYTSAPEVEGIDLASDFSYVRIYYSHPCYNNAGEDSLTTSNFSVSFAANGGTATGVSITSIEKANAGDGWRIVKLNLSVSGTVAGTEYFTITPLNIQDIDGNTVTETTNRIRLSTTDYAAYTLSDMSNTEQWGGAWTVEASAVTGGQVLRATSDSGGTKPNVGSKSVIRLANVPYNTKGVSIEFDYYFTSTSTTSGMGAIVGARQETPFDLQPAGYAVVMLYNGQYRIYRTNNAANQIVVVVQSATGVPGAINTVERLRVSFLVTGTDVQITLERNVAGVYTAIYSGTDVNGSDVFSKIGTVGFTDNYVTGSAPIGRFGNVVIKKISSLP